VKNDCLLHKLHETRKYVVWKKSGPLRLNFLLHVLITRH